MSSWIEALVLFAGAFLSGMLVVWFRPLKKEGLGILLTFGGAFLIGLLFLHLLPDIFNGELAHAGWYVIGGFLIQIILEYGSQGLEHGHSHIHKGEHQISFSLVIAMAVHALIEGMPFGDHHHEHHALLIGVILHKIPVAMVLASILVSTRMSRMNVTLSILVFALMAPLGMLAYLGLEQVFSNNLGELLTATTAILVGMLLHISTTILFEASDGHKYGLKKFIAVLVGIGLSWLASAA